MFDLKTQPLRQGTPQDAASLYMAFEKVQDRRKARGKRYPLPLILTLLFLGKLAGERTMSGALDWVNERKYWIKRVLHWPKDIPVQSTCTEALTQCDDEEVTRVLAQFFEKEHEERENRERKKNREKSNAGDRRQWMEKHAKERESMLLQINPLCIFCRSMTVKPELCEHKEPCQRRQTRSQEQKHFSAWNCSRGNY
jgi:DDE_Tnp_1-associated